MIAVRVYYESRKAAEAEMAELERDQGSKANAEQQDREKALEPNPQATCQKVKANLGSWRFHVGGDSKQERHAVDYNIPARQIKKSELGKLGKQGPWGIDCYSLGRLLSAVHAYGGAGEPKQTGTEAAIMVSPWSVLSEYCARTFCFTCIKRLTVQKKLALCMLRR